MTGRPSTTPAPLGRTRSGRNRRAVATALGVSLALVLVACSSSGEDAASTTEAANGSTTSTTTPPPTAPPETAPPAAAGVPVARVGGAGPNADDELSVWAEDHDLTVEWYAGDGVMVAVYRGLPLDGPALCLTNALETVAFTEFEGQTMAPTAEGGCEGGTFAEGSLEACRDVFVYTTAIPTAAPASRLFANVQLWTDGSIDADLSSLEFLEAAAPPYDPAALGC